MTGFHFPPQLSPDESDPAGHGGFHISLDQRALVDEMRTPASTDEASFSIARDAVSYTHLTLPTIYSV